MKLLYNLFPAHHIIHKQHSPGGGATGRSTNLRVVIPTPITSNMNTDDMSYAEVSFVCDSITITGMLKWNFII